tara:strand:- start:231 stop:860 length:630 start_codon:yes stop_codon:yes gene_type:complete
MKYRKQLPKLTPEESKEIYKLCAEGMILCDIAKKFDRPEATIAYHTWSKEKKENYLQKKREYNKRVYKKKQKTNLEYLNTEAGFIIAKYQDMKKSRKRKQGRLINTDKEIELLSQEEFFTLWEEHKAKHGYNCGYYNDEPIIMQRSAPNKNGKRNPTPKNLLSVDCLNPEKGYTKENIVFCGWAVNDRKNSIRKKDCHLIIRKYEERNQ